jgi:L-asparagine transporter-like permease
METEWKAADLCRIMVSVLILLFFGIGLWMIFREDSDERVYLIFDLISVWLMILIVFWLLMVEKVSRKQHQEP